MSRSRCLLVSSARACFAPFVCWAPLLRNQHFVFCITSVAAALLDINKERIGIGFMEAYDVCGRTKWQTSQFFFFFYTLYLCREEVRLLREELTEEYEVDKQAALTQLSQQKELEMMAAREGWQRKVEDLLEQVKHMGELFWLMLLRK